MGYNGEDAVIEYIPLEDCVPSAVYYLDSRNLDLGVFDGDEGFIGIRYKFGDVFLFTEYHWDTEHYRLHGTVRPLEQVGVVPEDIPLFVDYPDVCTKHNRDCRFDYRLPEGESSGWYHSDDDSFCCGFSGGGEVSKGGYNNALHDFLRAFLAEHPELQERGE